MLPCLTVMSCVEIEADASVASSLAAIFGLVEIDQTKGDHCYGGHCGQNNALAHLSSPYPDELRNGIGTLCAVPSVSPFTQADCSREKGKRLG
jgi:hypothetical protein